MPPRLCSPLLALAPGRWQVGAGPAIAFSASAEQAAALRAVDGTASVATVASRHGVTRQWLAPMVQHLTEYGHVITDPPPTQIAVVGEGRLSEAIGEELQIAGVHLVDPGRAEAAILATDAFAPRSDDVYRLELSGLPHLMVTGATHGVCLGPFVLPGRTPCWRCIHLTRRDQEPRWPLMSAQLEQLVSAPPRPAVQWAAAMATAQILSWQAGDLPDAAGSTWLFSHYRLSLQSWPAHAECGCLHPVEQAAA